MPYKDIEKERARKRADYKKNPDYWKQYRKDNQAQIDSNFRLSHVKRVYNLDAEEYLQMILDQNNCCLICKKPEHVKNSKGDIRPLSVDHCHKTSKVRGLLCNRCNAGLGHFQDDLERLKEAVKYLEMFKDT